MPDPQSLTDAMRSIRASTMANLTPGQIFLFEQLYTSWRNSMTDAGITVDENVLKALMLNLTMVGDEDWQGLAARFGMSVDGVMIAMLSVSVDPWRLE